MSYRILRELRRIPTWWLQELLRHVSCWSLMIFLLAAGGMEQHCLIVYIVGVLSGKMLWPELPAKPITLVGKEQSESEDPPPREGRSPADTKPDVRLPPESGPHKL